MAKIYSLSMTDPESQKQSRGTPIKTFIPEGKMSRTGKSLSNWAGTIICFAIAIGLAVYYFQRATFLGFDYYWENNKREIFRIILPLLAGWWYASSLGAGKKLIAEIYEKGFRIARGKTEYLYEYKDIQHLRRRIYRPGPMDETTTTFEIVLKTEELVTIRIDDSNLFLNISKYISQKFAEYQWKTLVEKYEKGERIAFQSFDVDKIGINIQGEIIGRGDIAEFLPERKDKRAVDIIGIEGKKIWSLHKDTIRDEYLFDLVLEHERKNYT